VLCSCILAFVCLYFKSVFMTMNNDLTVCLNYFVKPSLVKPLSKIDLTSRRHRKLAEYKIE